MYIGDEDGDVTILARGKKKKVIAEMNMGSAVYGTVVPANNALFLNNRSHCSNRAETRACGQLPSAPPSHSDNLGDARRSALALLTARGRRGCEGSRRRNRRRRWRSVAAVEWRQFRGTQALTGV